MLSLVVRSALAALLLGGAGARAAEIAPAVDEAGTAVLDLTGLIAPGDDAKLARALEPYRAGRSRLGDFDPKKLWSAPVWGGSRGEAAFSPRPVRLRLRSLGGNVQAALALGTLVREEGLSTAVPARGVCASACGLVWLAGSPRALDADAHVGLHAAYLRRNGVSVETGAANALIGSYLGRLGFGDKAIVYLTSAPPDDMTWIQPEDRQRYGIAFEAAPPRPSAEPPPEEHFLSKPMAFAGALASDAVAAVDRLIGRQAPPAAAR